MVSNIMLSLDLERGVSDERRQRYYAKLSALNWVKVPDVTTTWRCSFNNPVTPEGAAQVVKDDLAAASAAAGYPQYHAVAMLGDSKPVSYRN